MEKDTKKQKLKKVNKKARKVNEFDRNDDLKNTNNKKGKKSKSKKGWKIFRVILIIILALIIVGTGVVFGVISGIVNETDSISVSELTNQNQTSFFYDKDGNVVGSAHNSENRVVVEYKDLPQSLVDAVVSIEDERFFTHHGVDIKRTVGAVFTYVLNGGNSNFGGSTITQQLVKNISKDDETSWKRKIREWYRAFNLEKEASKEDIITSYLNTIYLGDGCYGVSTTSEDFFGKDISEISIAESAVLAASIQSPEVTNPYRNDEARQRLLDRKNLVLEKMYSLGKISKDEYESAKSENIEFKKAEQKDSSDVQSYFVDAVFDAVVSDLMDAKGIDKGVAQGLIYTQGYQIKTTMDSKVQSAIDSAYNNSSLFYKDSNGDFMQSAMVVMDQSTGDVVGLIGGADKKTSARSLNRATSSLFLRQLGSCMKPIGDYGPAFEAGVLSPGAGLDDAALTDKNYNPGNYYGYYNGYVTARDAIARSMNLPAIRANRLVSINTAYNFSVACGLTSLTNADKNQGSFALGGFQYGVRVIEAANAYATIANKGVHIDPKLYTEVLDSKGNVVLSNKNSTAKVVMKESTAYMLTSCLESVVLGNTSYGGTARGYVNIKNGSISVAGKTGNTNDDFDQWFCGFTPYYTIACWNGYDVNKSIGIRATLRDYPYTSIVLFNTVMNAICADKPAATFTKPSTVTTTELCKVSGKIATDACKQDPRGSQVGSDLVAADSIPTDTCTIHKMAKICEVSGKLAGDNCTKTVERSFITRDASLVNLKVGTSDSKYMLPTEVCTTCTKNTSTDDVNIYEVIDKENSTTNKTNNKK